MTIGCYLLFLISSTVSHYLKITAIPPGGGAGDALCVSVVDAVAAAVAAVAAADGARVPVLAPHVQVALGVGHQLLHLSHSPDYLGGYNMDHMVWAGDSNSFCNRV